LAGDAFDTEGTDAACDILYSVNETASSTAPVPSAEDVRGWLASLSTWGRWGPADDRGTLNYIGPEERRAALALATEGSTVSCALPITFDQSVHLPPSAPPPGIPHEGWARPLRFVIEDGTRAAPPTTRVVAYDAFLIAPHGPIVTHLDAPRHTVLDGVSYNGLPAGSPGAAGTVEAVADGILGRGILLDLPQAQGRAWLDDGEAIMPEHLEACEKAAGVRVGRGDLLFVRTGYRKRMPDGPSERHAPRPGLQAACLPWLSEREVAVIASDVANDVIPHGYEEIGLPIHAVGMWAIGLWLVDNCGLEELASTCARLGRWEFLSVLAPLVLRDGSGSPINPLAIF